MVSVRLVVGMGLMKSVRLAVITSIVGVRLVMKVSVMSVSLVMRVGRVRDSLSLWLDRKGSSKGGGDSEESNESVLDKHVG